MQQPKPACTPLQDMGRNAARQFRLGVSPVANAVQNRAAICRFAISWFSQPIQYLQPPIQVQSMDLDVVHRTNAEIGTQVQQYDAQGEEMIALDFGPLRQPTLTLAAAWRAAGVLPCRA
jgi:hypothetical protein